MGTRSLTVLKDGENREIAVLYRQMDGYVKNGHGDELIDFLEGTEIVNGISLDAKKTKQFNGMECLAAQVVSHFKGESIGTFYLCPAGTRHTGEEYIYTVFNNNGKPGLTVEDIYGKETKTLL